MLRCIITLNMHSKRIGTDNLEYYTITKDIAGAKGIYVFTRIALPTDISATTTLLYYNNNKQIFD